MSANRKHHYVPRFYLRRFSTTGKQINVFNLSRERIIANASLRDQCYSMKLYGEGETERSLASLEAHASRVIAEAIDTRAVPPRNTANHASLMTFVVLQTFRTQKAVRQQEEEIDMMAKAVLKRDPNIPHDVLESVRISVENPALFRLQRVVPLVPVTADLETCIIVNETNREFITSDHPVVLHNQYCENIEGVSSTGLGSSGLQILLPLSPQCLLLAYDKDVYSITGEVQRSVALGSEHDIAALNCLQLLNAEENVYFASAASGTSVRREFRRVRGRRREKPAVREFFRVDDPSRTLIQLSRPRLNVRLKCSVIRIVPSRLAVPEEDRILTQRSPRLAAAVEEFATEVYKGSVRPSEFPRYLEERVLPYVEREAPPGNDSGSIRGLVRSVLLRILRWLRR